MSLPEVIYRLNKKFQSAVIRYRYKRLAKIGADQFLTKASLPILPVPFLGQNEAILAKADNYREHQFDIFEVSFKTGPNINWHYDYKHKKTWPTIYCEDINYRDPEFGDYRYVWELNRHHHLVILGKAYQLTGDEEYAQEVCDQIFDWIKQNPPYVGINWTSALEASIRLISWIYSLDLIKDSKALTKDISCEAMKSVWLQTQFIAGNLSRFSSANNHLIGEAAWLALAGHKKGLAILEQEVEKQIYADGVSKEQAIHYQVFVYDFLSLVAQALNLKKDSSINKALDSMSYFLAHLMDKNGQLPAIGDSDDGHVIKTCEDEKDKNLRLFGRYKKAETRAYKEGGYYVIEENGQHLIFDCGSLGYLSIAAHGHADSLSVIFSAFGARFFVDPGTYLYNCEPSWRNYFRSTYAHNTIAIDGQDQSVMGGPFLWSSKADSEITSFVDNADCVYVKGRHNGYQRLKDPVFHEREIFFDKANNTFFLTDNICAKQDHQIEQIFHLSPECRVSGIDGSVVKIINGKHTLHLCMDSSLKLRLKKGWFSPAFGVKVPTVTIVGSKQGQGNQKLFTSFKAYENKCL